MKKILSTILFSLLFSSLTFAQTPENRQDSGKVLNIYSWNDEFMSLVKEYYPGYDLANDKIGDVKVNWVLIPNMDNRYHDTVSSLLQMNTKSTLDADKKIDLFLVEPFYGLDFIDSPYTLDMKSDLGFTEAELSRQFKYTHDLGTADGKLKALTWNCCPGGLVYRRSIAKSVLGTDDPDLVQKIFSSWSRFDAIAAKAKAKGYYMVSGADDNYRCFSDNMKTPWVVDGKIHVDESIKKWIAQQKLYSEKKYSKGTSLWSSEQMSGMNKRGRTFCYFGPAWYIDYVMAPNCSTDWNGKDSTHGDWAFCKGPQGFNWGGSYICAAAGSDNLDLVKDILTKLCCDDAVMKDIAAKTGDIVNNENAMKAITNSDYKNSFLGDQNHLGFFIDIAKSLDLSNTTPYDYQINEYLQASMQDYFSGKIDEATAWKNFYSAVTAAFPELTVSKDCPFAE